MRHEAPSLILFDLFRPKFVRIIVPIENNPLLGHVMAYRLCSKNPSPVPMIAQYTEEYVCYQGMILVANAAVGYETGYIDDGLLQERCDPSALSLELHLSCTNPSIYSQRNTMGYIVWLTKRILIFCRTTALRLVFYRTGIFDIIEHITCCHTCWNICVCMLLRRL